MDKPHRRPPPTRRKPVARTKKERVASSLYNLTLDINDLRQQIHQLCLHRALLLQPRALLRSPSDPDGSSAKKVETLFRVFNRGYRVHDDAPQAYMASLTGDAALYQRWRRHATVCVTRRCEVRAVRVVFTREQEEVDAYGNEDMDDITACVVRVEVVSYGTFTLGSLRAFFPTVLADPDVTQTLLGRAMTKPMVFHFEFNAKGRVVRFHIESDCFAALAQALEDPIRAATILNGMTTNSSPPEAAPTENKESMRDSQCQPSNNQDEHHGDLDNPVEQPMDPRHAVTFLLS